MKTKKMYLKYFLQHLKSYAFYAYLLKYLRYKTKFLLSSKKYNLCNDIIELNGKN